MSDTSADEEPTMEEILASIRRIISDEDDSAAASAEPASEEVVPAPEPEPEVEEAAFEPEPEVEFEAMPEPEPEPVFEPEPEPEPEPVYEPEPEPVFEPEPLMPEPEMEDDVFDLTDVADTHMEEDRIVSPVVEDRAAMSFAHLSNLLVAGYNGSTNTLEGMVREMLRPMLQAWLDENLPSIVQEAVEREVARISRRH